jgi:hypothetical protein
MRIAACLSIALTFYCYAKLVKRKSGKKVCHEKAAMAVARIIARRHHHSILRHQRLAINHPIRSQIVGVGNISS